MYKIIKELKQDVVNWASLAYHEINSVDASIDCEMELINNAMHKLLEKDRYNHQQQMELLTLVYMLQGIVYDTVTAYGPSEESEQYDIN